MDIYQVVYNLPKTGQIGVALSSWLNYTMLYNFKCYIMLKHLEMLHYIATLFSYNTMTM